jgi:hypothetical protein
VNPEIQKRLESTIDQVVGNFIEKLPDLIRNRLETMVAKCLGFEKDSWGSGWKVDHCNGRQTTIGNYVSTRSQQIAAELIGKFEWKPEPGQLEGLQKEFKEQVERKVRESFWKRADEKAEEIIQQILDKEITLEQIEGSLDPKKLYNPDYGKTKIQEILVTQHLRDNFASGEEPLEVCPDCNGKGSVYPHEKSDDDCQTCNGSGEVPVQ